MSKRRRGNMAGRRLGKTQSPRLLCMRRKAGVGTVKATERRPKKSELAGYGFGLPLTRLHAQYFGGDVFMQALPGLGTDMYLILTHLKEGTPSTEIDDLSTVLYTRENSRSDP